MFWYYYDRFDKRSGEKVGDFFAGRQSYRIKLLWNSGDIVGGLD